MMRVFICWKRPDGWLDLPGVFTDVYCDQYIFYGNVLQWSVWLGWFLLHQIPWFILYLHRLTAGVVVVRVWNCFLIHFPSLCKKSTIAQPNVIFVQCFFFLPTNNFHLSWSWKIPSVWLTFFTAHLLSRPHSEPDSRTPSVHLPGYLKILKNFMVRFILSPICPQWERHPNVDKVSVAKCCVSQVWRSLITKCTCVFYASA